MEHGKIYALVPEESLSKHVPTKRQMSEFDTAVSKILNSPIPDHEKLIQYFELLKRKIGLQEFNMPWTSKRSEQAPAKKEMIKPKTEPEQDSSLILSSVPYTIKRQAQTLQDFLKNNPRKFEWDNNLTVHFEENPIPDSNMADLFGCFP